jgi:hypothetical protein
MEPTKDSARSRAFAAERMGKVADNLTAPSGRKVNRPVYEPDPAPICGLIQSARLLPMKYGSPYSPADTDSVSRETMRG